MLDWRRSEPRTLWRVTSPETTGTVGCPFCRIATTDDLSSAYVVYADRSFFVMLDRESLGPGHCMVIPRRHVREVHDLSETEYFQLFGLARRVVPILRASTGAHAVAYTAFGSGLPHAHLHLVPHDDEQVLLEPMRFLRRLSDQELAANAAQLRALFARSID
jgi:diadenosine tetraphosphate (Ap4A) HIT family hydrolase